MYWRAPHRRLVADLPTACQACLRPPPDSAGSPHGRRQTCADADLLHRGEVLTLIDGETTCARSRRGSRARVSTRRRLCGSRSTVVSGFQVSGLRAGTGRGAHEHAGYPIARSLTWKRPVIAGCACPRHRRICRPGSPRSCEFRRADLPTTRRSSEPDSSLLAAIFDSAVVSWPCGCRRTRTHDMTEKGSLRPRSGRATARARERATMMTTFSC